MPDARHQAVPDPVVAQDEPPAAVDRHPVGLRGVGGQFGVECPYVLEHREVVDCARGVRGHRQVTVLRRGGPVPDRGVRIAGGQGGERCVLRTARLRRPEPEELVDQPLAGIAQPVESGADVPSGRGRRQRQDVRGRQLPIGLLDDGKPVGHPSDLPSGGRECQAGHPEGVLPVDLRRHPL